MLEQAVYAGRNHTLSLAVALTLLTAPSARAEAVRVGARESTGALVAAPGGGVWFTSAVELTERSAMLRVRADGRVTRTPFDGMLGAGAAGADGAAYFLSFPSPLVRVDDSGTLSPVRLSPAQPGVAAEAIAAGPDGRVWVTTRDLHRLAQIAPDGSTTYVASGRRDCSRYDVNHFSMARASD